jgi:hypothetical protein
MPMIIQMPFVHYQKDLLTPILGLPFLPCRQMVVHFSPPRKKYFLRGEKMSGFFSEDENNPNWRRYKAHFIY